MESIKKYRYEIIVDLYQEFGNVEYFEFAIEAFNKMHDGILFAHIVKHKEINDNNGKSNN